MEPVKTDKQREEERCGGCDCYETDDGCECRVVPCSNCGTCEPLFDMNHPEKHSEYWFNGMEFELKLAEVLCDGCVAGTSSEEEGELSSDDEVECEDD